jgi:iron complex outermembrane receptor protein
VRYTYDHKQVNESDFAVRVGERTFVNTTYAVSASYQWTPDVLTFVRVDSGVRAGGFNVRATPGENFLFLPEKAQSEEVGIKSQFWNDHARINAGLFYTSYKDLQITEFTGATTTGLGGQTYNATANYRGGELELAVVPVRGLTGSVNFGYVDPRYNQIFLVNPATGLNQNYADMARFPYVARWNANAAIDYEMPLSFATLRAHLDASGMSKRYFFISNLSNQSPLSNVIASNAWGALDARLSLANFTVRGITAELSLWVDNLTNKFYRLSGVDFGSAGFAGNVYNAPRTAGVEFNVKL